MLHFSTDFVRSFSFTYSYRLVFFSVPELKLWTKFCCRSINFHLNCSYFGPCKLCGQNCDFEFSVTKFHFTMLLVLININVLIDFFLSFISSWIHIATSEPIKVENMADSNANQERPRGMEALKQHVIDNKVDVALWASRVLTIIFAIGYVLPIFGFVLILFYY